MLRRLFHSAAYSKCDVPSEIFQTQYMPYELQRQTLLHNALPNVYAMIYIKMQSVRQVVKWTDELCS